MVVTHIVAMGNSKGIVKRLRIETTDARKYLKTRYDFNDYRKYNYREIL